MKTQKIFLSSGLGALIGTIVAIKLIPFWFLGTIVGFLVGYLAYEVKNVLQAIVKAFKVARHEVFPGFWKRFVAHGSVTNLGIGTWCLSYVLSYLLAKFFITDEPEIGALMIFFYSIFAFSFSIPIFAVFIKITEYGAKIDNPRNLVYRGGYKHIREKGSTYLGIIKWFFLGFSIVVWSVVKFFFWVMWKYTSIFVWKTVFFCAVFLKKMFLLIHSDVRLLCGTDAAIGTVIGYFFQSPIVGCLAGAILGLANYYIVSIKILKLQPESEN